MKKIKVAILSGGPSSEHEVSLKSAENVMNILQDSRFELLNIKISKESVWIDVASKKQFTEKEGIAYLKENKVDLVFIVLHGEYGEDGTVQRLLEEEGLKFTGSNFAASSLAMDKVASAKVFEEASLNTPSFISVNVEEWEAGADKFIDSAVRAFSLPLVVKPTDRGSSVGTAIVEDPNVLRKAVEEAFKISNNVMIQKFIKGRELTCAVIEDKNGDEIALVPTEILPGEDYKFFDYSAKYVSGASVELTPPNLSKKLIQEIQNQAVIAHKSLGCSHVSRADFILADDTLYILEVNTIPGLTETSLLPQGAKAMGIELSTLMEIIIEAALRP
jgi:D-alanine-D-alanine ligase